MTVSSYLKRISENAIIRKNEKDSIKTSIYTISHRLKNYFGTDIKDQFIFGSYTRGTILPRSMDEKSDIDYMVVFENAGVKPQAYLTRLRRFVELYYSSSDIKQSHPAIKLNLNHITFELVPAHRTWLGSYRIPSGSSYVNDWMGTNPNDFNNDLIEMNKEHAYVIKPLIRLMKYWNAQNNYVFDSFKLEKWILEQDFQGLSLLHIPDLKNYLFKCFDKLSTYGLTETNKIKLNRAKNIIYEVRRLEKMGYPASAEDKIKKLLPDPQSVSSRGVMSVLGKYR